MKLFVQLVFLACGCLSSSQGESNGVHLRNRPGLAAKVKGKISSSAKKEKDLATILFPGVTPEEYDIGEKVCPFFLRHYRVFVCLYINGV